jgi:hypothetical protein
MQMLRLESAAPFGSGVITDYNCVADTGLMQQMVRYRRAVAGSYQAVTRDEIAGKFTNGRFAVSPKIDGEIWFLMCHENDACLVNPRGQVIHGGIPILDEARRFASRCVGLTILAGELFAATKDGRPRVGDVAVLFGGGASAKVDALGSHLSIWFAVAMVKQPCRLTATTIVSRSSSVYAMEANELRP